MLRPNVIFLVILSLLGLSLHSSAAPTIGATGVTPPSITANTATTVTATAQITDAMLIAGSVNLLRQDTVGKTTAIVGQMHDDGKNGDAVAGDNVYTFQTSLTEPVGTVYFAVSAAFKGQLKRVISTPFTVTVSSATAPQITSFTPTSAAVGDSVTITGGGFAPAGGGLPQVSLAALPTGTIAAPVTSATATALTFTVPPGAATGLITVTVGGQSATSSASLTVTVPAPPVLAPAASTASVIQGQSTTYTLSFPPDPNFTQLTTLSLSGLPSGVTAAFKPAQITSGQFSLLTVTASASQATGTFTLTASASATVNGVPESQSLPLTLQVLPLTTSFRGRTVVDDALETPLAGVTVRFLGKDDTGKPTGANAVTVSDASGNFAFTNLPASYVGNQLIQYDGLTATSPPGRYSGVDLLYKITAHQVTTSPVLIHLPRLDNAETILVPQNASVDHIYTFKTISHLSVTVYAHTTITLPDGTKPNPFPLIAIQVPVDRLPDTMPAMQGGVMPFIVAFQPANTVSSQPVAVTFPNSLMTPPKTDVALSTLDPTKGYMVQYGTGTVTSDGLQIVPDPDPKYAGHRYGLVHFDWHGPATPPNPLNPTPSGCHLGDPVDVGSGLMTLSVTDVAVAGSRGSLVLTRNYRTFTNNVGPFGLGGSDNYNYQLNTNTLTSSAVINLIEPDGNQTAFSQQANGTYVSTAMTMTQGTVLTVSPDNSGADLRFKNGMVYHFVPSVSPTYSGALLTQITDRNGNVTTLTRNSSDPLQLTKVTDPVGRTLTFTYGNATYPDLITSVIDPSGRTVQYSYTTTSTLFGTLVSEFPLLTSATDPTGGVTQYGYQALPNTLVALESITDPRGIVRGQNVFDDNGRVLQQTAPDGGVTQFSYTPLNPLVSTSPNLQTVVTDPLGRQTIYRFSPQGYLLGVTDPSGQTTAYTLDPETNQVVAVNHSSSGAAPGDFTASYDANGNVLTATDALGDTTKFTYEPTFNQVASITDPLGHVSSFTYDTHGNRLTATDPNGKTAKLTYNSAGQVLTATDPLGKVTRFAYDPAGNLSAVTDPLGHSAKIAYDAVSRPVRVTDPLNRVSSVQYDNLDRVLSITDPLGHAVSFTHDPNGNLLSLTDALGHANTFTYDTLNRPLTRQTPLGKTDTRKYDLAGNLTQFTDRRGQVSKFAYNPLDQLIGEAYQDGSAVSRTYDAYSRLLNVADTAGGAYTYAYDLDSRLIGQDSPTGAIQYVYNAANELLSRQVAGQPAASYAYDPAGRLLSAALAGTGLQFTYDDRGEVTGITRANGVASQFTYDDAGRLTSLAHAKGVTLLYSQTYAYDTAGQRTASALSSAQPLITPTVANTYDAENHLLKNGPNTDTYDANGNLLSETGPGGTTAYAWDTRGRLTKLTRPNGSALTFTYDPGGEMNAQTESASGLTRSYLLDALTNVVSYNDGVSGPSAVLTGLGIDSHFAIVTPGGSAEYGLTDALGSTTAVTDGSGTVQGRFAYEPYGQTTATGVEANYPFQYTGRVPVSSSLYYNRARFYNSLVGRFISEDPVGFAGGPNLYDYTDNAPLERDDPSGTDFIVYGGLNISVQAAILGGSSEVGRVYDFGPGGLLTVANYFSCGGGGAGVTSAHDLKFKAGLGPVFAFGSGDLHGGFTTGSDYLQLGPVSFIWNDQYQGIAIGTQFGVGRGESYTTLQSGTEKTLLNLDDSPEDIYGRDNPTTINQRLNQRF